MTAADSSATDYGFTTGCCCSNCMAAAAAEARISYDSDGYPVASGDITIDALVGDTLARWNWRLPYGSPVEVTYSFRDSADNVNYDTIYDFQPFTTAMQDAVRQILGQYDAQTGLQFREVSGEIGGQIQFGMYSGRDGVPEGIPNDGEAIMPYEYTSGHGDVWINWSTADSETLNPAAGNGGYFLLTHEIGHALGLKHPGQYSYFDAGPFLPADQDNTANTVMSYNGNGATTGPAPYDFHALQFLYGTQESESLTTPAVGYFDGSSYEVTGDIYPAVSTVYELHYSGTNDAYITATNADEIIFGAANENGYDQLIGSGGNDTIYGRLGYDDIYGNIGQDVLFGGQQDDRLFGGKDEDAVYGNNGNDILYGNFYNDSLFGGQGNDVLFGGQNEDLLFGNLGDDTLNGNRGNDTLVGGDGSDVFVMRAGGGYDTVVDFNASQGDQLDLVSGQFTSILDDGAGNTVIAFTDGSQLVISGVEASVVNGALLLS